MEKFEGGWVIPEEDREEVPEDNNAIDEFMSSHGFEYVDATKDIGPCKLGETLEQSEVDDGIPGVVRVVDALSTIMWPSMKTLNKGKGEAPIETGSARWIEAKLANDPFIKMLDGLDGAAHEDHQGVESMLENFGDEVELSDYMPVDESSGDRISVSKAVGSLAFPKSYEQSRRTEEALQAWYKHLDEYPEPKGIFADIGQSNKATADAWINWMPVGPSSPYSGPFSDLSAGGGSSLRGQGTPTKHGFDDDFTDFMSAPPLSSKSSSAYGRDSPDSDESGDTTVPKHEYETLTDEAGDVQTRDASEGEGDEDGQQEEQEEQEEGANEEEVHSTAFDEDESDDALPSKEEIRETAKKIFGTARKSDEFPALSSPPPSTTKSKPTEAFSIDALSELIAQESGGATNDFAAFDMPKVLGALQHMKAEIATMKNEDERRKAAAKVALGLVYGLEAEAEVENVLGGPRV
ncbi:hypothetical protein BDQ12DRAFT_680182 [Crucibulum laeve]|uniref:Uncharacterized protein n=1 Tax=Crucibulum laeve TaxID=68775 RepID=A0A5C3MI65_9AGAR|nr:hypothetical protein BDQ12DRAFT_680182 [Crucibulum laeve]